MAPQPVAEASVETTMCLDTCSRGTPARRNARSDQGLKVRRQDGVSEICAVAPCPSRDLVVKPTLKRSHMKQSERHDSGWGWHMPQEPLKMFQWNRPLALERLQASQHWLSTLLWETCCEVDRVQLHSEKRDPLCRGEFALFPVDLKSQPAEVTEHHIPVFAQQCSRLGQDEPVVEVVEDTNACFP